VTFKSKSNWGDWIGSQLKGPEWTPYAQAIAEHYPIQVPWFYTLPSNLTTTPQRQTVLTRPQQHDVLIFGASAIVRGGFFDEGNYIFLQITHQETGIPWVVPNIVGSVPLPAIAGAVNVAFNPNTTMTLKLPEAFFLPKHNRLKLDWIAQTDFANTNALITFMGIQLIGRESPKEIKIPNGDTIPIGSRLPWFITLGLGEFLNSTSGVFFALDANVQSAQFTAPQDCDIEIHDCYFNSKYENITGVNTDNLTLKLTEMGREGNWTPAPAPQTAVFGDERQVNPTLPFTKPFLLRAGHKLSFVDQNNLTPAASLVQGLLTFRGVRLCQY